MKALLRAVTKGLLGIGLTIGLAAIVVAALPKAGERIDVSTKHKTMTVDGLEIFYREAGRKDAPTILLLHGFPTSSHMFRNLVNNEAARNIAPLRNIARGRVAWIPLTHLPRDITSF